MRRGRCKDSPLNSAVGGAATGALLFASHGAAAPRGAVICGAMGAAGHWAVDKVNFEQNYRKLLIAWGLLDPSAAPKTTPKPPQAPVLASGDGTSEKSSGEVASDNGFWKRLRPYYPIRKLNDEEWEQHQRKTAAAEERARRAALEGVHPDVLDIKNK